MKRKTAQKSISIHLLNSLAKQGKTLYKGIGRPRKTDYRHEYEIDINIQKKRKLRSRKTSKAESWQVVGAICFFLGVISFSFLSALYSHIAVQNDNRVILSPIGKEAPKGEIKTLSAEAEVTKVTDCNFIELEIGKYKNWDVKTMTAIAMSENGFEMWGNKWKANAQYAGNYDGSVDTGIFMVNSNTLQDFVSRGKIENITVKDLFDYKTNIAVANVIFSEQGYNAWADYKNGRFEKYLEGCKLYE